MSSILEVRVREQELEAYRQFNEGEFEKLLKTARVLSGKRIVHVNSTATGGGVAELLQSQVPLERGLGLDSRWLVIQPENPQFFAVTKQMHNLFQGKGGELSQTGQDLYETESKKLQRALEEKLKDLTPDILICHDTQPLMAVSTFASPAAKILRIHPDICQPNPWIIEWLCRRIGKFQHVIVSREDCTAACLPFGVTSAIAPAIDPLAAKNQPVSLEEARNILARHGLDTTRPIISQISRFDPWKDPVGVVEAYRLAKQEVPGLQLVLVGFVEAPDDPEASEFVSKARAAAGEDSDVYIFSDLGQLKEATNAEFVRAVQTASEVVLQKSTREGFGLTVTEAMWKGKVVIGGNVGGIKLQITSYQNGILVNSRQKAGEALVALLQDTALRERLGAAARETVREKFLLPRFVRENLEVYSKVI